MVFEEVENGTWTPENEGDSITGVLVAKEKEVGPNKCMLYHLQKDEKSVSVWGSVILDQRMMFVNEGSIVRITYKGRGEAKPGHNPPKIFKVEVDKSTDEEQKVA